HTNRPGTNIDYYLQGTGPGSTPYGTPRLLRLRLVTQQEGNLRPRTNQIAILFMATALPVLSQTGIGLRGEYFNTIDLTGPVEVIRTDTAVNFEWNGAPAFGVDNDE